MYFKGDWLRPFKESKTTVKPFHLSAEQPVDSDFMSQRGVFSYNNFGDFEMIHLPYRDLQFQASVLLPSEGQEVDTFLQTLTAESMNTWQAQLTKQDGIIELPKFKLENSYSLVPNMQNLGLRKPFGRGAEFAKMSSRSLFISEIIHKVRRPKQSSKIDWKFIRQTQSFHDEQDMYYKPPVLLSISCIVLSLTYKPYIDT